MHPRISPAIKSTLGNSTILRKQIMINGQYFAFNVIGIHAIAVFPSGFNNALKI
jgi:hypothetical protein